MKHSENRAAGDLIPFGDHGGITPQTFTQVVDWAKMMAKATGMRCRRRADWQLLALVSPSLS